MAAKNILSQLNIVEVGALTDSGTAFIGFGAKADGLYMRNGAAAELRLLTAGDIGVNVALYGHTHSGYQATLSGTGFVKSTAGVISYDTNTYVTGTPWTGMGYITGTPWTGMGYVTGTPWTLMGYLTSQTSHADVLVDGEFASQGIMLRGATSGSYSILTNNSSNWNTAYGWGNHASAGYAAAVHTHTTANLTDWASATSSFQSTLVSGTNIKTVGGSALLGSGDIPFVVPNYSVNAAKLSVYNGASQGALLTYDSTYSLTWTSANYYALSGHNHSGVYAPVFSLTTTGTSGAATYSGNVLNIPQYAGTSYTLPLAANGTRGGVQVGYANYMGTIGISLSGEQLICNLAKGPIEYVLTGLIGSHSHNYAPVNGSSSNAFSTANLSVTGTIAASSTITGSEVYRGSSRKLKKDIADFDYDAIGFLNDVSIKRYYLKSNNLFGIGFIAEDTHPWLSGDDQKSHVFGNHLGILTKAIQEEDQKVEDLKLEVLELRARVRELEIARQNGWN